MKATKVFYLFSILLVLSCSDKKGTSENGSTEIRVAVVNYPLYYFAKTIGGDQLSVYFPSIDGDPAYWKPSSEQVNSFQNADLIFSNGAGYAQWMDKVSLPTSKVVVTAEAFRENWIETDEGITHSHGPEGEHVHASLASNTWLNFRYAILQAEEIYNALVKLMPERKDMLDKNYQELKSDLQELDETMYDIAGGLSGFQLLASHPVYQYLATAYGLDIESFHLEPYEMPSEEVWHELEHHTESDQKTVMLWEGVPIPEAGERLENMDIEVLVFDICANRPKTGDFLSVMRNNLVALEAVSNRK
jgi:zinc transport system substrate-binding protein